MASLFSSSLDLIKWLHFYRRWRSLMAASRRSLTHGAGLWCGFLEWEIAVAGGGQKGWGVQGAEARRSLCRDKSGRHREEFCFFSGMLGRIRESLISKSNNAAMAFVSNSTGMSVWFEQFFRGSWQGEYNSSQLAVLGDQMTQRFSLKAEGILLAARDQAHLCRFTISSNGDQELRAV